MSTELIEKVDEILKNADMPERHTFYQIQKFIIGKEPTGQAQLWAIVRELKARRETVDSFRKDLADAEDNVELFDIKIERFDRLLREAASAGESSLDLNIREYEINIRKLQRERESLILAARSVNAKLKAVLEETGYLARAYESVVSQIGPMKPLDDEASQQEMWNEKLLEEFNLRLILQRPLDPEFVRTVLCLHDEAPVKKHMTAMISQIQQKMLTHGATRRPQADVRPRVQGG